MKSLRKKRSALLVVLLATCMALVSTSAWAGDETPGDPPAANAAETVVIETGPAGTSPYALEEAGKIFMPFLRQRPNGMVVNPQDRQEALDFYIEHYLTSEGLATGWTGNHASCTPGSTSSDFQQSVLQRINYFRAMAGVAGNILFSNEDNRKAQAAALMMSVNNQLSHSPPTTWLCYSQDGADGAGKSDLYLGRSGPGAITGYIKDPGAGNYFAGHRRWILYPPTKYMGTGDIPAVSGYNTSNALYVLDFTGADPNPVRRDEFVAWPPPGYVPYQVVFPRWSISYPAADFSSATVTMTSGGAPVPVAQAAPVNGYGDNTLVWIPNGMGDSAIWPAPAADTTYTVTVQGVKIGSTTRTFTYNVIVFNPTP